jgi:hypothetical protein
MTAQQITTMKELAHRSGDGVDVTLLWVRNGDADETLVRVTDHREGAYFEIQAEPQLALHIYHHPFAYRNLSTIDHQESRLAA